MTFVLIYRKKKKNSTVNNCKFTKSDLTFNPVSLLFIRCQIQCCFTVAVYQSGISTTTQQQRAHFRPATTTTTTATTTTSHSFIASIATKRETADLAFEAASCRGVNIHRSTAFTLAPLWQDNDIHG